MTTDEIMALADKYAESDVDFVLLGDPDPKPFRDALQSAIEALQADAARYRWLRDDDRGRALSMGAIEWTGKKELADAAIDAAMALDKP